MNREWSEKGVCSEGSVMEKIKGHTFDYYVAFQVDKFLAGSSKVDSIDRIDVDKLLEVRLFSDKDELLFNRTMIGAEHEFSWRIASENDGERDFLVKYQTLDIDSEKTSGGDFGNLNLMTTGGGKYELPISRNADRIKIYSYIDYDSEDGMAYIYDNRLVGFEEKR